MTRISFTIKGWSEKNTKLIHETLTKLNIGGIHFKRGSLVNRKVTQFDTENHNITSQEKCKDVGLMEDNTVYGTQDYVSTVKRTKK